MSRIPQAFIDDLLSRIDIVQVIEARVPLKKAGNEWKACCPFHDEKTPSFNVVPNKQFYHCFGCGEHGTAIGFLIEYDRLPFRDAVEELARIAGVEVPVEYSQPQDGNRDRLYDITEKAAVFYEQQLKQTPRATDYLKARGLDGKIAKAFRMGYAPDGWTHLSEHLADEELSLLAGLAAKRDRGGNYDRFRDRIMFPIRDTRGRVIAFGGRIIDGDGAKYLNSPETPLFHKGNELYGLYEARQASRELKRILVVEGYMDVVALAQSGIPYAVATLGTATTEEHLEKLFRWTPVVVFCFDGDRAGRQAAERAMDRALPALKDGREIRYLFLPDGEDPDSLVRAEGAEAFTSRLDNAVPLSNFLLDQLCLDIDLDSVDGRARLVETAREPMSRIQPSAFRSLLLNELGRLTGMTRSDLARLYQFDEGGEDNSRSPDEPPSYYPGDDRSPPGSHNANARTSVSSVRRAIQLLLERPALATELSDSVIDPVELRRIEARGVALLCEMLEFLQSNPTFNTASVIEHFRDHPEGRHLSRLTSSAMPVPADGIEQEFIDAINRLRPLPQKQRSQQLLNKAARGDVLSAAEMDELNHLVGANKAKKASSPDESQN